MTAPFDLKCRARALGFDAARIASAEEPWPATGRLAAFVAEGRHGEMDWMETTLDRRSHPRAMWPAARSALVVAANYGPAQDPMEALDRREEAAISVYAQGDDYHDRLKGRLKSLAGEFARATGHEVKVFVDTAPLMEKPLAERAGIGWQGKHTNLVSREYGSWLFLGVLLTDALLAPDAPAPDACGACTACLDVCPTRAFPAPYQLDARRCLSYLTIEHKSQIPREFRAAMGNRIFGCDDCLAVCPWNKFARCAADAAFAARPHMAGARLEDLSRLDDRSFRDMFPKSPVKRIGRDRFIRNVVISLGNSGSPQAVDAVRERLDDADARVRGAAVWALARLAPADLFEAERNARLSLEADDDVIGEWHAGRDA